MKQRNKKSKKGLLFAMAGVVLLAAACLALGMISESGSPGEQDIEETPNTKLYWNVDGLKFRNPEDPTLSDRVPGEDGMYHIRFSVDGEQVEFTVADKRLVNLIDAVRLTGLELDEGGNIVDIIPADKIAAEVAASFFVQRINGNTLTLNASVELNGMKRIITLDDAVGVYDVTPQAEVVGAKAGCKPLDKVMVYGDLDRNPTHVYIMERMPEADVYWRVARMYDPDTKGTSRKPDENGVYTVLAAKDGVHVEVKFRAEQKNLVDLIDKGGRYNGGFAPIFDEEGYVIELLGVTKALRGRSAAVNYRITSLDESGFTCEYLMTGRSQGQSWTGKYHPHCKIYNVSDGGTADQIGEATTLQIGDRVLVFTNTEDEAVLIYVVNRLVDSPIYWNHTRKYSSKTRETTRIPDENGYYVFRVAANGKDMTVRTKSKTLATKMDACSPQWFALELGGDVVKKVFPATMATEGAACANWFTVGSISGEEIVTYSASGSSITKLKPAQDMKVYNVANVYDSHWGERTTLRVGDQIHALTDCSGKTAVIYVRTRKADSPLYWNVARRYNTTRGETTRKPDAEGYYVYDLAVNGEVRQFKTNDKEIADLIDSYRIAFALKVDGDIIKQVYAATVAKGIKGSAASWLDVMSINGNKVYVRQNVGTASDYGKGYEISLAKNYVVYDACGYVNAFGSKVTLGIGDRIHAFTNDDGEAAVIYIVRDNTRQAGGIGYCDHCNKEVVWAPWSGETFHATDGHYHLTHDLTVTRQLSVGKEKGGEVYDIVLDLNGHSLNANAGSFRVWGGSIFSLMDSVGTGIVAAKGSSGKAGSILVTGGGRFDLYGGTLTLCEDTVTVRRGGIIYLSGDNSAVNIYGGTIVGGEATEGGNIYVAGGSFNMTGGKLEQGRASLHGGNLFVCGNASTTVSGSAVIAGGIAGASGGNICICGENGDKKSELPVLTVSGGKISGGKLSSGGGSNIQSCCGGGITISGGKIAGDILLGADADGITHKVVLSGAPLIGKGLNNGLNLDGGAADISGLTDGAKICISTVGPFTAQMNNPESYKKYFTPYDSAMSILVADKALVLGLVAPCQHCNGANTVWSAWPGDGLPQKDGHYRLTMDTNLSAQLTIGADNTTYSVVIDLYGKTLTAEKRFALLWKGSKLSVMDSVGGGVIQTKGYSEKANAGSILVQSGAELNMYSGTLKPAAQGIQAGKGGIIHMSAAATTVNMYGGTIDGGHITAGGAVFINSGVFNLYGGAVTGGAVTGSGGNFCLEGGVLNVYGGSIENGTSGAVGGNIYADRASKVNISGGTVSRGAAFCGGNIFAYDNAVITVAGTAVIADGVATGSGGNICIAEVDGDTSGELPALFITGGAIFGGKLDGGKGSNVLTCRGAAVTISGGKIAGDVVIGDDMNGSAHTLSITGKPMICAGISGGLDLGGRTIDPTQLHADTRICISGVGVFTGALTDPENYEGMFQAYSGDRKVGVLGNSLYLYSYTLCAHCEEKVVWTPWAGGSVIPEGHICLSGNAAYTGGAEIKGTAPARKDIVIDLRGNKLTSNTRLCIQHLDLTVLDSVGGGVWERVGIADNGGVVRVSTGATLNLYGGTVAVYEDHAQTTGDVVRVDASDAALNVYGGTIQGGDHVAALLVGSGTFNMTGGVIQGRNPDMHNITIQNSANVTIGGNAEVCGGILVESCGVFKLTGSPVINKSKEFGLKLPQGKKLTIEDLSADAKISVTALGIFVTNTDTAALKSWKQNNFTSDDLTKEIVIDGKDLTFRTVISITRCAFGHTSHRGCDACPAPIVEWKPWVSAYSLPTQGNYFLTSDVTVAVRTRISGDVRIDLNGCDIVGKFDDRITGANRGMLAVSGNLDITDLSGRTKPGAIRAELDSANIADKTNYACGVGVIAYVSGKMTLYNGILDGSNCATDRTGGSAIAVESTQYGSNGIFTMYGGAIKGVNGAERTNGSTISGWGNTIINIHGGELIGRSAHKGANIYTTGELTITGGKLTGGALRKYDMANGLGQNIYFDGAAHDLTISGNAELNGGVYVDSCRTVTLGGAPRIIGDGIYGLRLPAGVKADVNGLLTNALIGITLDADGAFATATNAAKLDALRYSFITDIATKEVVLIGNDLVRRDISCVAGYQRGS